MVSKAGPEMKIAVSSISFSQNETLREELLLHFSRVDFNSEKTSFSAKELAGFARGADALLVGQEKIDAALLAACPNLRVIAKYGVGLDNIDLAACQKAKVDVLWEGGLNKRSVAELSVALMIMLFRNMLPVIEALRAGKWQRPTAAQLSGKRIGLIGMGHVGKEVARLLKAFDCEIWVNDIVAQSRYYRKEALIEKPKAEIFKHCDLVSIHTPLTAETSGMVDAKVLSSMKKTAFLLNTARGKIVRQADLKRALQKGLIAGAALDVFEIEPSDDPRFLALPNLIPTSHIGANAIEAKLAMGRSAIARLKDFAKL